MEREGMGQAPFFLHIRQVFFALVGKGVRYACQIPQESQDWLMPGGHPHPVIAGMMNTGTPALKDTLIILPGTDERDLSISCAGTVFFPAFMIFSCS
jgi:hypothetical protein